jgi:hypothetical protein
MPDGLHITRPQYDKVISNYGKNLVNSKFKGPKKLDYENLYN